MIIRAPIGMVALHAREFGPDGTFTVLRSELHAEILPDGYIIGLLGWVRWDESGKVTMVTSYVNDTMVERMCENATGAEWAFVQAIQTLRRGDPAASRRWEEWRDEMKVKLPLPVPAVGLDD